ncbi:hypothetical protein GCM10027090_41610 [Sinomonas soli]
MIAARTHDQPVSTLYSTVTVMSDGVNGPLAWGKDGRPARTVRGDRMAQQQDPDDWVGATARLSRSGTQTLEEDSASESPLVDLTVPDLIRYAKARGIHWPSLLVQLSHELAASAPRG